MDRTVVRRLLVVTALVVTPFWLLLVMCSGSLEEAAKAPRAPEDPIFSARVDAEEKVKAILKDPDSARFGQEWVREPKLPIVCGEVNAKNSFGGFAGASEFIVLGAGAFVREHGSDDDRSFVRMWNQLCIDHPAATKRRSPRKKGATS